MIRYSELYRDLKEFVIQNDPGGLIDMGAPKDEYDNYYSQILSVAKNSQSKEELLNYLLKLFSSFDGLNENNCKKVAEFIWKRIDDIKI